MNAADNPLLRPWHTPHAMPPFGDIDVHTRAYLTASRDSPPETGLWTRSTRAALLGVDVLVPSPTDRLVNAIAHGVLDAHRHSDWLVDCAQLVGEGGAIDWPLVVTLAEDLGIPAQVTVALFYLREVLAQPVPEVALAHLWDDLRRGLAAVAALPAADGATPVPQPA